METVNAETTKNKKPAMLWLGFGTVVLGTLTFFGIKHFTNKKQNNNDNNNQKSDSVDVEKTVQSRTSSKPHPGLSPARSSSTFPLRLGYKGDKIKLLQQSLIRTYGGAILPKHGADGQFGTELQSALRSKGYAVPLQETDFSKITQKEQTQQVPKAQTPLLSYDTASVAKGIYYSIMGMDFNAAITLLKSIRNTTNYSLVSEQFRNYRIEGVRQTLANGLLHAFTESAQKLKIQNALKNIGLKYDGTKWRLS